MYFYLSFADPKLPTGTQFLGCTIVEAENAIMAIDKSWTMKINPGGEVKIHGFDIMPDDVADMVNRLVPRVEALERGVDWK